MSTSTRQICVHVRSIFVVARIARLLQASFWVTSDAIRRAHFCAVEILIADARRREKKCDSFYAF